MVVIELLAPAKDLKCGVSAIKCGADAVYIGAPLFGARSSACNDIEDIKKLIDFAHLYYARVYITVNTILTDEELPQAQKLINDLYNLNADGIIIQDTGLLELDLPPIPLIASTQMHNVSKKKIKFLEQIGFKRIILARELSLNEIEDIHNEVNIELEAFIHGALCVSYSGQCYMSYAIGGRSGNRGQCAQPCRKKYSLKDNNGQIIAKNLYLLSLKDMNRSSYIEDMIKAGITSFKIEGRLKDESYVKNVVSFYRREIDTVLEKLSIKKASSGYSYIDFEPDPLKTFNRGFTTYFLKGRSKDIASPNTPKSTGEPIGKIEKTGQNYFKLDNDIKIAPGDGICFFNADNELCGTIINQVIENRILPQEMNELKEGLKINRNNDNNFIKKLKSTQIDRFIDVDFMLTEGNNEYILKAVDEDGIAAESSISVSGESAQNKNMLLNNLDKQLSKLGDTEFTLSKLSMNLYNYYFIPVKDINELRRQAIEWLRKNRSAKRPIEHFEIIKNNVPYPKDKLDFSTNIYNKKAIDFYKRHGIKQFEMAAENY